jgi:hypothetical protein
MNLNVCINHNLVKKFVVRYCIYYDLQTKKMTLPVQLHQHPQGCQTSRAQETEDDPGLDYFSVVQVLNLKGANNCKVMYDTGNFPSICIESRASRGWTSPGGS